MYVNVNNVNHFADSFTFDFHNYHLSSVRFLLMSKAGWYLKLHMPTPQVICMTAYKKLELH